MADKSSIEWTDATWNPITGCSVVSPGCTNCYAMRYAGTRGKHLASRAGLTTLEKTGPVWTGEVRFNEDLLDQPLRWRRPRVIFVCAHGDLFHEDVRLAWIVKVLAVAALCPRHTLQILTKRAARMREVLLNPDLPAMIEVEIDRLVMAARRGRHGTKLPVDLQRGWHRWIKGPALPLPNVWLGVSAERQPEVDERIHELRFTPAALRFVSIEPMLAPVNLTRLNDVGTVATDALRGIRVHPDRDGEPVDGDKPLAPIDWVIVGGESAQNKPGRPMHPDWPRSLRDQCQDAGVAFNFKQWGDWAPVTRADGIPGRPAMVRRGDISMLPNGRVAEIDPADLHFPDGFEARGAPMRRVGKKAAGRLLDGRTWDEMPKGAGS